MILCRCFLLSFALMALSWPHINALLSQTAPTAGNARRTSPLFLAAEVPTEKEAPMVDRRLFLGGGLAGVAGLISSSMGDSQEILLTQPLIDDSKTKSAATTTAVSSVEYAIRWIESYCDKRFLHAVVASDYQFLYETKSSQELLVDPSQVFSKGNRRDNVEGNNGIVTLATTGNLASKRSASLWPLHMTSTERIHYAWPQEGGRLGTKDDQTNIVDGIDCEKISLEDALEGNMQVLVQAPSFLTVPHSMEQALRKGLKNAFLI